MSKISHSAGLVVEWSPRGVVSYDLTTRQRKFAADFASLNLNGREAVLAIARGSIFVRSARVPNAAPEEIRMVLQMTLGELFPLPAPDLAYDFILTSDVNEEGRLALVVAMPSADLRRALEQAKAGGLKVVRVVPTALGTTLITDSLSMHDAAVVEQGDHGVSIDVVSEGVLRASRVVPYGTGLEAEITRTSALAKIPTGHRIAVGDLEFPGLDARSNEGTLEALAQAPIDRLKLNLVLPETLAAKAASERQGRQRLAFLLFAAALVCATLVYFDRSDAAQEISKQQSTYAASLRRAKSTQSAAETEANRTATLRQALVEAFQPAQALSDVVQVVASDVPQGVWLTGIAAERGKTLTIRGVSKTNDGVAAYLRALLGEKRLRDVKLVGATNSRIENTPVVQFSLSAFPVGNLPVVDPELNKPGVRS